MIHDGRQVLVVGAGPMLELCAASLTERSGEVRRVPVERIPGSGHNLQPLAEFPPDRWYAFAAVGNDLLNMLRLGLMSELRNAGYRLVRIVSPSAHTPSGWQPGENAYIGDQAVIGPGAAIRHNTIIGAGAILGTAVTVGHSVWIGAGAIVGARSTIGASTVIAAEAVLRDGLRIGRQCELGVAREYHEDIPDRTYLAHPFEDAVQIFSRGNP
jgi:hypothetical protein